MKTLQGKLNNKGSSLVAVIIAMGFIGILGASALAVGVMGHQMKIVEAGAKENQYSAEATLNRLCSGLQEVAENKMEEAYTFALTRHSVTKAEERLTFAKEKYVDFMDAYLREKAGAGESAAYTITEEGKVKSLRLTDTQRETLIRWLDKLDETDESGFVLNNGVTDIVFRRAAGLEGDEYSVTLTNISTRYKKGAFETGITTDIKLSASEMGAKEVVDTASANNLATYGLIADGMVSSGTTANVRGNVYAGEKLSGESGSRINIEATKVLSRGTIETKGGASLKIKGTLSETGETKSCDIWADDIRTEAVKVDEGEPDREPVRQLDLNGTVNIANDLAMNNPMGNVYLAGEYYGYGTVTGSQSTTYGSSIGINAPKAQLDLSGLDKLHLGGRAAISVDSTDVGGGSSSVTPIMQGEALSYLWTQNAYLLPGDCLPGIGHNPMTLEEHETFKTLTGADKFNITRYVPVALRKYLDTTNPYTEIFVKHYVNDTQTIMVYLYMNFSTPGLTSTYFQEYAQSMFQKDDMVAMATMLGFKGTLLNSGITATDGSDSKLRVAGNVVGYTQGLLDTDGYISSMGAMTVSSGAIYTDGKFSNVSIDKTYSRNGLVSYLDGDKKISNPTTTLTENIINVAEVTASPMKTTDFIAKQGDVIITSKFTGLVIVDGDVTINAPVTGLVIATGNITVNDATVTADPTILSTLVNEGIDLQKYLKVDLGATTRKAKIDESGAESKATGTETYDRVIISFENWRKA